MYSCGFPDDSRDDDGGGDAYALSSRPTRVDMS